MNCRDKLETYLRENAVPFQVQHHPVAYTSQEVASKEHISGKFVAKVVIVVADGRKVMLVLPATLRVDFAKTAAAVGAKELRLAREDEFSTSFPECEVGAMPPFGNLYGLPVFVDRSLSEDETIIFQAGTHVDTMSVKYADFARLAQPTLTDLSRH